MADEPQNTDQTPQSAPQAPSEPLPQAEATPSEPAKPVEQTAQSSTSETAPETPTAHIPANEPLPPDSEPIVIPPFDNSPTPTPQAPAPSPASAGRSGRDLLVKARQTIQERKQKKLQKILELLDVKKKITNDEVEKLLHVSDATATRYLSALEKQGKIRQVGRTGKAVVYTRI